MKNRSALAFCLALGVTSLAVADDDSSRGYGTYSYRADDRWYVTPFIGGISPDHKRGLVDHDFLYGLAIGHEFGPFLNLELNFDAARLGQRRDFNYNRPYFGGNPNYYPSGSFNSSGQFIPGGGFFGPGHLNTYDVALRALGVLNRDGFFSPYGVIGVGLQHDVYPSPGPDYTHLAPEAGIGAFVNVWESPDRTSGLSLRPEIKARWDNPGRDYHYVDYIATIGFQFSFGGTAAPRHAETTTYETTTETYTAPPPPPEPPVAPPPPPPAASILPESGSVTLTGVTFMHDSTRLTTTSHHYLDEMARGLRDHPNMRVEIQGHTDSTGSATYNEHLSQRRADSVRQYLLERGVSPSQVVAHGYGETQPLESNSTAAGRAQNRRVVAKVLSNPSNVAVKGAGETHLATPATPR